MPPILEELATKLRANNRELDAAFSNFREALSEGDNVLAQEYLGGVIAALTQFSDNANAMAKEMEINI